MNIYIKELEYISDELLCIGFILEMLCNLRNDEINVDEIQNMLIKLNRRILELRDETNNVLSYSNFC